MPDLVNEGMGSDGFLSKKYTIPPEQRDAPATQNTETQTAETTAQTTPLVETQAQQTETGTVTEKPAETKPDEFIESLNKKFGTQFKAETEVKDIFGLPQKIAGYESELTKAKDYAKQIEDYEKQIEEFKNNGNQELLSKPLIRQAYVADQLLAKYPDKDPYTLQQIVMADVSKMSDLDVLVKEKKIDLPGLSEKDIKEALLDQYGIDPEVAPEEWSSIVKTKIAIAAQSARANIKSLTNGIELPKQTTKEERESALAKAQQERIQQTEPLKAKFLQFDKFEKGDFKYDSPAEFKSKLPEMFQAMFIDAGLDPTEENLQTAVELRDSMFLYQNFDKIKEVIAKQAQTELQKKLDEALHNTTPPNTTTATDQGSQEDITTKQGLSKFLLDNK